jgi:hypothetical protein
MVLYIWFKFKGEKYETEHYLVYDDGGFCCRHG